jgi:hypothetical protein
MRASMAAIAATLATVLTLPASATVRIASDSGGQIGPYLEKLETLRNSGQNVIIDGPCLSACTMVLGVIPRDRICVTQRALLGFHAAWKPDADGHQVTNQEGTELLMSRYPEQVREWIVQHGGLSPRMIYLAGHDLAAMYPSCQRDAGTETIRSRWSPSRGGLPHPAYSGFAQGADRAGGTARHPMSGRRRRTDAATAR